MPIGGVVSGKVCVCSLRSRLVHARWGIANGWVLLSDDVPSFVYMTNNEVDKYLGVCYSDSGGDGRGGVH